MTFITCHQDRKSASYASLDEYMEINFNDVMLKLGDELNKGLSSYWVGFPANTESVF